MDKKLYSSQYGGCTITALATTIKRFWRKSPHDVWIASKRRGRRLLGKADQGWNYSLEAVLASLKHMNAKLEIERWERHWRICRLHGMPQLEAAFEFNNKNIMELGCGPILGSGPFAVFHGAERFWYREPDILRKVVESKPIKDRYFVPMYDELVSNYGQKVSFNSWYSRLIEVSQPLPAGATNVVDITISNSVLEHISPARLFTILAELFVASRPGSRFSHTVDFGPHGGRLADLYVRDRDNEPLHLNLLRKSEIKDLLAAAGFEVSAAIPYKIDAIERSEVHETWQAYPIDDLATRVMIFIGGKPERPVQ